LIFLARLQGQALLTRPSGEQFWRFEASNATSDISNLKQKLQKLK
jgi:hypothetical protein